MSRRLLAPRARAVLLSVVLVSLVVVSDVGAQFEPSPTTTSTSTTTAPTDEAGDEEQNSALSPEPGRVAWVGENDEVFVAESDGSEQRQIGSSVAKNRVGLSPLAWAPTADRIAYVRTTGELMVANTDGSGEQTVASDAVVPPDADETIVSFDVSGSSIAYLAGASNGRARAAVVNLETGQIDALNDPDDRVIVGMRYSTSDPFMYLISRDPDDGSPFSLSLINPFGGAIFPTPWAFDDPVFSPDGEFVLAVASAKGKEELVRLDTTKGRLDVLGDLDQVCQPSISPDAKRVIMAAGERCDEVWIANTDGTDWKQVVASVGGSQTFAEGAFTWSRDGKIVSHAACRTLEVGLECGGPYWNIDPDGSPEGRSAITASTRAGSVMREAVPLIRAAKLEVQIQGPVDYSGKFLVSPDSVAELLQSTGGEVVEAKAIDERDADRFVSMKLHHTNDSRFLNGLLRVADGQELVVADDTGAGTSDGAATGSPEVPQGSIPADQVSSTTEAGSDDGSGDASTTTVVEAKDPFDETIYVFASAVAISFRYAEIRGVWVQTDHLPWRSGNFTISITR